MARRTSVDADTADGTHWQQRVVQRSLDAATRRSIDRSARFIRAAATVLERTNGASLTVQEVADVAGQSVRTLYQYFESKDDLLLAVHEEAMRTYARLIRDAIASFDDPVERLAAGVIASARLPAVHHKAGRDRGLSRLRLQLAQADPALLARSQEPLTALFCELVDASGAGAPTGLSVDEGTYVLSALRTALVHSWTLGNDLGVELPDAVDLSCFCLAGLGLTRARKWHDSVDRRLHLT